MTHARNTLSDYLRAFRAPLTLLDALLGRGGYFLLGIVASAVVTTLFA